MRDGQYVHVAMGSLIDPPSIRPDHHIFVGSKAPWYEITDDLPQFQEYAGLVPRATSPQLGHPRPCTRAEISSRIARTAAGGCPAGSGSSQSM